MRASEKDGFEGVFESNGFYPHDTAKNENIGRSRGIAEREGRKDVLPYAGIEGAESVRNREQERAKKKMTRAERFKLSSIRLEALKKK